MNKFETRRTDGLSNQEVIANLVCEGEPGRVYTYDELQQALEIGADREYDRKAIQGVVRLAKLRLLREHKRTLTVVANVGYRLAHARDHRGIAGDQTKRGQRQMKRALTTLENARLDEMTTAERELHIAQCSINSILYTEQQRILSRQHKTETIIARLTSRVEQLEGEKPTEGATDGK